MTHCTIDVRLDTRKIQDDISLLSKAAQASLQVRQRFLDLGDLGSHLVCVDADRAFSPWAGELGIRLEFANGLADLVSAVRAGQFD